MSCELLSGISQLIPKYDYFLIDVWGVVHDGNEIYNGVIEALELIKSQNKKICFLSNAPRRASKLSIQFDRLKIDRSLYDFILTSGEATFSSLKSNQESDFKKFGRRYFYIGPDRDSDLLFGLDYEISQSIDQSSFVLVTGFDNDNSELEEKMHYAIQARKRNLTMICANPDLKVVRKSGTEVLCAGALARFYKEKLGGEVIYYGKPYSEVYKLAFEKIAVSNLKKVLAIGDAIETDMIGAEYSGIDGLFVTGGIYKNYFSSKVNQQVLLSNLFSEHKCNPKYAISNFKI